MNPTEKLIVEVPETFRAYAEAFGLTPEILANMLCRAAVAQDAPEIILTRLEPGAAKPLVQGTIAQRAKGGKR